MLILRFSSCSLAIVILPIKYATNEPEGVQLKSILTKCDFLLCVHVVVETLKGSFSNDDGNGKENVTSNKHRPNRDYFRLFHFVRILYYCQSTLQVVGVRDVKLNTEN